RKGLIAQLAKRGLEPSDVTDVILTHSHYDHSLNWILFRQARIIIGARELAWSMAEPWGETPVPELYIRELESWPSLQPVAAEQVCLPGLRAHAEFGGEMPQTLKSAMLFLALSTAALLHTTDAAAQAYPSKPVRMIIPFPPGGSNDVVGRMIAFQLSERLGRQVVVDNQGGAGGIIGTEAVA